MKIPIKKYTMDKKASWEVRYKKLEKHHREETQWLIDQIKRLETELALKAEVSEGKTLLERIRALDSRPRTGLSDLVIC